MSRSPIGPAKRFVRGLSVMACIAISTATMLPVISNSAELSDRDAAFERSQILDLLANTLASFDDRDFPGFAANFTDDGVFMVVDAQSNKTLTRLARADIVATFNRMPPPKSQVNTSNLTVDFVDSSHGTLRGYYMVLRNDDPNTAPRIIGMGRYASRVVKQNGKWKFLEYHALSASRAEAPPTSN